MVVVRMDSVLLVSSSEKGKDLLVQLLKASSFSQITIASSGSEARRLVSQNNYDVVVINAPLSDEFGHELSIMAVDTGLCGAILIAKNEIADEISAKVEPYGVFMVPKPLNRAFFYQALKLVCASRRRLMGLQNENVKLHTKIEEIRLVDRAKCTLIQYLNMSEQQAHRYIEKQAMDMRLTKKEIAKSILKTYEM